MYLSSAERYQLQASLGSIYSDLVFAPRTSSAARLEELLAGAVNQVLAAEAELAHG